MTKQFLTYQEFLNEGLSSSRKAFLTTGKIGPEDFERLTSLDVTPKKKYLDSICRFYIEGHSEQEIKNYIDKFHILGANLTKKDINLYDFQELKSTLDGYTSKNQKDKLVTKDIEVVYEDERFFIVRPETFEQSAKYGRGTKWCITATDGTGQEAWDGYRRLGYTFYFITDKSLLPKNPLYKVVIAVDKEGQITYDSNSTVNSLNEEIEGEEYIEENELDLDIFVPRELTPLEIWGIDLSKLKDGVYNDRIHAPYDIKEFKGFKEELGIDIKEVKGYLYFGCNSLISVSNLPQYIGGFLYFECCYSLTSISNLPEYVGESLEFWKCTSLTSVSNLPDYVGGGLSFRNCTALTSFPDLPEYVGDYLDFESCTSLTSIEKMPSVIGNYIWTLNCPFFEGMNEAQIRQKYNISSE